MGRNMDIHGRDWWSTAEIARYFGTSPRTVRRWAHDPDLIRMGGVRRRSDGKWLRLHWRIVDEWLKRQTLEDAPAAARDEWNWQPGKPGRPPKWAQAMRREAG